MSLTLSPTTYSGRLASDFIVKAMIENEAVSGGHVYVQDGIRKSFTIPRLSLSNIVQDRAETPTSHGSIVIDGATLSPMDYMVYLEFNPRDFEAHWFAEDLDPELLDRRLPATVESALIQEIIRQHASYLGRALFSGSLGGTPPYDKFDGFIAKAEADTHTLQVANPVALTTSNLVAKLEEVFQLIPEALRYDPDMKLFVSYATADLYRKVQQAQSSKGIDMTEGGVLRFNGKTMVPMFGMPNDCVLAAKGMASPESNLWLGMNSRADENYVKLMPVANNSELWFVKMLMKADTQIGFANEVVLYKA